MISIKEITIEEFRNNIYDRYTKLFPKDEQREWKKIEKTYTNGIEHFYNVTLNDKTIGFIILEKIDDNPYYLDYFAIYDEYQNKGYGTEVIKYLLNNIIKDDGLIAEIETVNDNNIQTKKRLKFYKELGFVDIDSEYLLYNVHYTPIVYLKNIDKEAIDEMFLKYYIINVGKEALLINYKKLK
ncbi:MAG: GNAT family N-acetyltransferase [Bacilli bacterium]|nr:GNAT family N-acetyltransferase [Bacilli bacterium]